jgi:hypothetical protein
MAKQASKDKAIAAATAWSSRVDLPAYVYKTERGWKWAADRIIANMASALVETIDTNALRAHLRKAGSAKTAAKASASAENGKKGGRPKGKKKS